MSETGTYGRRRIRELLNGVLRVAAERRVRRLLITSVSVGSGKTTLCRALKEEAARSPDEDVAFVSMQYLDRVSPDELSGHGLILVDGPASIEVDGLSALPLRWRQALDGVVLVVVKRETRRGAVEEARRWLESNGLPIVAVVWNEHVLPPFAIQLDRLRRWVATTILRRPKSDLTDRVRQLGRPLEEDQ